MATAGVDSGKVACGYSAGLAGIGIDLEAVDRFAEPDERLLNPEELAYCAGQGDPAASRAGRWCAKEAVVKACAKFLQLSLREVGIRVDPSGRPTVLLPGRALDMGLVAEVAIAYSGQMAVAVAIAGLCPGESAADDAGQGPCAGAD